MAEEERKRRRGRRRGGKPGNVPQGRPDEAQESGGPPETGDLEITGASDATGLTGSRFRIRRRGAGEKRPRQKEEVSAGSADVSPMDFWRSGTARTHRERPAPRAPGPAGLWRRLTSLYFPPWVPVVVIIFVVFGILGLLFVTRSATGAPRIGKDHWHATYQYIVCGKKQPNFPTWEGVGVHTHGDGVIHIHPFTPSEEGQGASLENWFKYGGGTLSGDTVRAPGSSKEYHNGDTCDDGTAGTVQVSVNHRKLDDWSRFIPHDGDAVRIVFGPPEDITQLDDRQIIPDAQATRTINVEVSGDTDADAKFTPSSLEVNSGEAVKIVVKNTGKLSHGFRAAGDDGKYDTADDFVVKPDAAQTGTDTGDILQPGQQGSVVVRFDTATKVEFHDSATVSATGSFIVRPAAQASPSPSAAAQEPVDVTLDVNVGGSGYDPAQLTLDAGKKFRINLTNGDTFIHNLRIDGPDGLFRTDDDIVTKADVAGGQAGEVVGQIDKPGTYNFRDDFHSTKITGTITVE